MFDIVLNKYVFLYYFVSDWVFDGLLGFICKM